MKKGNDNSKKIVSLRSRTKKQDKKPLTYVQTVHKRRVIAITTVISLVVLFFGYQIIRAKLAQNEINNTIITTQDKLKKQKKENEELKIKAKQLQDDDYIQKIIRSKYYYSKDGEQIYSIPGGDNIESDSK
ncbi:septum formation initiator family protein [Lactobacillus sp. YT155]|uniref:FtsB family cell division protein n=1 Tax=Lactobacillus sp. YT155 TaxID=3060955 RepID=UPI00265E1750|nr:septum formation initiator family protein [Lactobacillus sp. YT155]MDO1604586.1 septum formation initiator family protein [Lactobacillus sp. YT155]